MKYVFLWVLLCIHYVAFSQNNISQKELTNTIMAFSKTSSVTGREEQAQQFIKSLFDKGICRQDKLGNIILTIGSGHPIRLFTTPLDEPGYVISQIQEDGYLKIAPVGFGHQGKMYHQFLQGNDMMINSETATTPAVSTTPSSHYDGLRVSPEKNKSVFQWQDAIIDVGVSNASEVYKKGIKLLDPITLRKKPMVLADKYYTAPSISTKAASIALASVAKTLLKTHFQGTVVFAFTTLELINGKGIEAVVNEYGPFDEVIRFNRFLNKNTSQEDKILVNKIIPTNKTPQEIVTPSIPFRHPSTIAPNWGNAKVYEVGLSSNYINTPIETVSISSVEQLMQCWLRCIDNMDWTVSTINYNDINQKPIGYTSFQKEEKLLSQLVGCYGVAPDEKPVRDFILSSLPKWTHPTTDEKGNIIISFGKGKEHDVFVAHMDEVGFVVDSILSDGRLALKEVGGFFNWIWEGHTALVHLEHHDVPAVFEPRNNYLQNTQRNLSIHPLYVNAGYTSKQEALLAGVLIGKTTVTMPKALVRLSDSKASARGFDDRVGCASLLLALENINPNTLHKKITFIFSTGEETGLVGSTFAENNLTDITLGFPIDTYVSSDAPMESKMFGYCPLGKGAVIRVLESINFIDRTHLNKMLEVAKQNNIKVQYGMTAGGTDGQGFLQKGVPSIPLSWPGRYSHSPVEVMDFNDMQQLVHLISAIMQSP